MRLTRVYIGQQGGLRAGADIELSATASEHIARVLRLRVGADVVAFDGQGGEWRARVSRIVRNRVNIECLGHDAIERESPLAITLLQSLARGEKMDWVIQKATELGVGSIIPVSAERSVVQIDDERAATRLAHWRAVVASACEQSGRNRLPEVQAPLGLSLACQAKLPALRLVLMPGATPTLAAAAARLAADGHQAVALLVGPEGGLTDAELAQAQAGGFVPVGFGARVLRTETAAIAAITALQLLHGDLGDTRRC